jgi:hypothetical protein
MIGLGCPKTLLDLFFLGIGIAAIAERPFSTGNYINNLIVSIYDFN